MWFNLLFSLTRFFDLPFSLCGCRATVIEHWVTEDSAHDSWLRSSKSSVWQSCFQDCCSAMVVFQKGVLVTTNHFTCTVAFLPRFQHYFLLIWIRQKNKGNILIHEKVMYSYAFWSTSEYFAFVRGMFPNTLLKWQLVGYSFRQGVEFLISKWIWDLCCKQILWNGTSTHYFLIYGMHHLGTFWISFVFAIKQTSSWWVVLTIGFSFPMFSEWNIPQCYDKHIYIYILWYNIKALKIAVCYWRGQMK